MEEIFLKFKGSDWAGMILGLLSVYFLTREKRSGFILGILSSAAWLVFGFLTMSIASIASNLLFIGINARGYLLWKRKDEGVKQ